MRAFVKTGHGYAEAELQDVVLRDPGPGEVLLKVHHCGVCGSDLHAYRSDPGYEWVRTPVALGHEFSGSVEAVGVGVSELKPGDRVVAMAQQGCGRCPACLVGNSHLCPYREVIGITYSGGMAQYAVVPERHLVSVPEGIDLDLAAVAEPISVAVHAVVVRAGLRPGDLAVVSGPGPIGLLCGMVAKLSGAEVIVTGVGSDSASRLPAAERAGLKTANLDEHPLDEQLRHEFGNRAPDAWIESSGAVAALSSALETVRPGGAITVVGIYPGQMDFAPTPAVRSELSVLFSFASNYPDYVTALDLLARGALDPSPLLSTYRLENVLEAFDAAADGRAVKAMLVP